MSPQLSVLRKKQTGDEILSYNTDERDSDRDTHNACLSLCLPLLFTILADCHGDLRGTDGSVCV